jgi:N-acetylmuramoyl-L-alanine amidase
VRLKRGTLIKSTMRYSLRNVGVRVVSEARRMQSRAPLRIVTVDLLAFLLLITGCAVSGCARLRRGPPSHLYEGPLVEVRRLDTSSLKGKRIVLDPGHGGAFPGAIGRGGLKEAQVNLGVALYLWGMLRDAGAEVFLTRSSDRDFLYGEKSSLRDDLSRRVEIALAFKPDLFLSLHHNADIFRSRDRNQIETYFKMLDGKPSEDVALLIHERLTESLGISEGQVVPGNYFVLRNMPCSAVLGEPSYISNPWVEEKLRLAEKQLLEAQAYFLGILEYFNRGVPRIASLSPCDSVLADAQPALTAAIASERAAIDTSSVLFELDGTAIARSVESEGKLASARPEKPLANGRHEFCVSCRNLNGNSTAERCCHFEVSLPPSSLIAKAWPDCLPWKGGVLVTAEAKDVNGNRVKDGVPIQFFGQHGLLSAESVATLDGMATSVFFPDASAGEKLVRVNCRSLTDISFLGDSLILIPCPAPTRVATQAIRIVADSTGKPLENAQLRSWGNDSLLAMSSSQGLMVFAVDTREGIILERRGFIPSPVLIATVITPGYGSSAAETISVGNENLMTIKMRAAAAGRFLDTKIALDIALGLEREERVRAGNPMSDAKATESRANKLTTEVGARLEGILSGAGAQVLVLDETAPDEEKVRRAELFGAQMYLRIELSSHGSACVLHYPGSSAGTKLAQEIASSWAALLSVREPSVKEDAHYVIRQTSSPAVIAMLPASARNADEKFASTFAYALFLGVLEDLGLKRDQLAKLAVTAVSRVSNESLDVVFDDFIPLRVSAGEGVTFFCEEGLHLVRARSRDGRNALKFVSLKKGGRAELQLTLE